MKVKITKLIKIELFLALISIKKNLKMKLYVMIYIELLIQFELEQCCNLRAFILDPKTAKKRFECLINIDIIKG